MNDGQDYTAFGFVKTVFPRVYLWIVAKLTSGCYGATFADFNDGGYGFSVYSMKGNVVSNLELCIS